MKLDLIRYDKGEVSDLVEVTEDGFIKGKAIVTRTGVFLYKNGDGSIRKELRHPDDVLQKDSLETMKLIPVVDGHPEEKLVTADNAKRLSVGYTGEFVDQEGQFIKANVVITDKDVINKITTKKRNELSLGYTVDLEPESGVYDGEEYDFRQKNIRYNHLALVDIARAGPMARISLDGEDAMQMSKEETKKMRKIKIDDNEYMMEDEAGAAVERMMRDFHERIKKLEDCLDVAHAERDSLKAVEEVDPPSEMKTRAVEEPKNEHYPEDLPKVSKVDSAEFRAAVKARVALEKHASKYLDSKTLENLDGMSDLSLKKAVISRIEKGSNLDGKSEIYIDARFDSAIDRLKSKREQAEVIARPAYYKNVTANDKDDADAVEARSRYIQKLTNRGA
jgi:hypothetical protein